MLSVDFALTPRSYCLVPRRLSHSLSARKGRREGERGRDVWQILFSRWPFRAEKRKKHARTLRERGAPKVSKMAVILIFLFSTIYYATADIPVSSDNFPTQEDSCRYNLAVVRFSYCSLNFKKDFKALDVPAACKQIASTSLLLSWTFLQQATKHLSIWRNGMTNGTENSRNSKNFREKGQQVVHIFDSVPQI